MVAQGLSHKFYICFGLVSPVSSFQLTSAKKKGKKAKSDLVCLLAEMRNLLLFLLNPKPALDRISQIYILKRGSTSKRVICPPWKQSPRSMQDYVNNLRSKLPQKKNVRKTNKFNNAVWSSKTLYLDYFSRLYLCREKHKVRNPKLQKKILQMELGRQDSTNFQPRDLALYG